MTERFEDMLTGGHPNSLGRTIEVVDQVLANPTKIEELFSCYSSEDEVVRLRVSNALRRVQGVRPDLILPLMDRLQSEIANLDQPSAQWTLPKLFEGADKDMSPQQNERALEIVKRNLADHSDWIVLNNSIDYLTPRAATDHDLRDWLIPYLNRHADDARKSVAKRAQKALTKLERI